MSKNLRGIFPVLLMIILVVVGCKRLDDLDGIETVDYQSEFAVPLFSTATTFKDLLEDFDENSVLSVDSTGLLTLTYSGDVNSKNTGDLYDIINDTPPFPVDTFMALPFEAPNNIDVDYIILKTGKLNYLFQSEHTEDIDVTVILPEVTKDGVPLSDNVSLSYDGSDILWIAPEIDISGYRLEPVNDLLTVRYICTKESGDRDTLTNFIMRSEINFEDPKIRISVLNSFGFPVRSIMRVVNIFTLAGDTLGLESPFIDSGIDFEYPSLSEAGEVKETVFFFDKTNSNIQEVLSKIPVAVDYDFDAISNPDMNEDLRGFLLDTSRFRIAVEVKLPLYGTAKDFGITDSFDLDFSGYDDVDEVEFKLVGDNGIPMELDIQLYFADENNVILDSLFMEGESRVLDAAKVDQNGEVASNTETVKFLPISGDRFERVKTTKRLLLTSSFSTQNMGSIPSKLKSDQSIDIRMGMKIKVSN